MTLGMPGRGTLCIASNGIISNIDNFDTFSLGTMISFSSLDYIMDQLGDLHLQDPKPIM